MSRVFPYPVLIVGLTISWLLLTNFSLGQLIVGIGVALIAAQGLAALQPSKPRLRRWGLIPKLIGIVLLDIIKSNYEVVCIILKGNKAVRQAGFVTIPLELRDPTALAILAVIVTSTPGTAWIDYSANRGELMIHVFDLVDAQGWVDLIKGRYEYLLMEIFE